MQQEHFSEKGERNLNWAVFTVPADCKNIFVCVDEAMFDERIKNGLIPLHDNRIQAAASIPCFIAYAPTSDLTHLDILAGLQTAKQENQLKCLDNFNDETVLHYCTKQEMADAFEKYGGMDWLIGNEADLKELTANMAGFGAEKSQCVIIDYDKGYGKFLVRRVSKVYRASGDAL